jgi:hypothetical protein
MVIKISHQYDDIINLEYHKSKKHPPMSLYARSAQFAPFAALTGYEDAVRETSRITSERIELDDELKSILDMKLQLIRENIGKKEEIKFTYFEPDERKEGGAYVTIDGVVKKFDEINHTIVLTNKMQIPIDDLLDIQSTIAVHS